MKTLLFAYIISVNLFSFLIMGIDKWKAIRKKWRVSERTLFFLALFCGSIGILIGMYVFHHKTRKLRFAVGIPALLVIQLLLLGLLFSWNQKLMGSPAQAVQSELELIEELDPEVIQSFVSYENLTNSQHAAGDIDADTAEAVTLFFQNFKYNIHQEQISGDEATVSVNITNIDMHALARDLCRELFARSVELFPTQTTFTTSDYYQLLHHMLSSHSYEEVVTTAYFHLNRDENGWYILVDEQLQDELVSGFISYMNDPYLLSASEALTIQLDAFTELNADDWSNYLSIHDIFATYNTNYYTQIDEEFAAQLASSFSYEILRCEEQENQATAVLRITSLDMPHILSLYKEKLLAYAATTQSIRDDDVTFSNETSRLLLEALKENTSTISTDINLTFHNNGTSWCIYFDENFTNAVMGDINSAIRTFRAISEDVHTEIVLPGR